MSSAPVSLGKGAWCCDTDSEIPPEREAEVFEERATSEILFEGMDTVPPRKDVDHVAVFHEGCRYRVTYSEKETVLQLKKNCGTEVWGEDGVEASSLERKTTRPKQEP